MTWKLEDKRTDVVVCQSTFGTETRAPARGRPSHMTWLLMRVRIWEGRPRSRIRGMRKAAGALAPATSRLTD